MENFRPVTPEEFQKSLDEYQDYRLSFQDGYYGMTFSFPGSSLPDQTITDDVEKVHKRVIKLSQSHPAYRDNGYCTIKNRMLYCGTMARKEGTLIKYDAVILAAVPTSDDSEVVQYPKMSACHGDKCRIFDQTSRQVFIFNSLKS